MKSRFHTFAFVTPSNTKFIQICSGVRDGDQVLLSPPSDTKEKDLGGAIIADDEALPPGVTNQIARAKAPGIDQGAKDRGRPGSDKMRPIPVLADDSRSSQTARPMPTEFSGSSTNQADLLKRFDVDGDGKLNAAEQANME